MIPKHIIDEIFQTARIEEVIGEFVHLKKAGSNLKGLSPFVEEKTPSFMVSPAKQIFKDFSSGKGGNVVSFLMELEGYSYPEALKWLAEKYNIEIPQEKEQTAEQIQAQNKRESLSIVSKFANDYFQNAMWETGEGKSVALSYFRNRGFSDETIKSFELGYCPDTGAALSDAALKEGYNKEYLVEVGLSKNYDGKLRDFFRGRVMFPIHNVSGKVIAFGGRTLKKDKNIAKYFNSPESEIYHKSRVLYGLYQAKTALLKHDLCYLTEGYTDVISLHQAGLHHVVASSGTALTSDQIRLIKRYTHNITVLYDGDAAGIKASFRGIDLILEQGMNVRVVLFPDGEDPDSFAKGHSQDELLTYLNEHTQDFISFKTGVLLEDAQNDPIKKSQLIHQLVHSVALVPDSITRSVYTKQIADRFEMDEQTLIFELNKQRRSISAEKEKRTGFEPKTDHPLEIAQPLAKKQTRISEETAEFQERDLIRILLSYGHQNTEIDTGEEEDNGDPIYAEVNVARYIVHQLQEDDFSIEAPIYKDIYFEYLSYLENEEIPSIAHFTQHPNPKINQIAVDVLSYEYSISENWKKKEIYVKNEKEHLLESIDSAIHSFKEKRINLLINNLQEAMKNEKDEEELIQLLMENNRYLQIRKELAKITGRTILK